MSSVLSGDSLQLALIAAVVIGALAPMVGAFAVQRRMSLIGDGIGHVAVTGVAVGLVTGTAPLLTAMVSAIIAAVLIEVIRIRTRTSGDVALALMFYGGIALGVVVASQASEVSESDLEKYLFGSIETVSSSDLVVFTALAAAILATTVAVRQRLFAVSLDEEFARASGIPVFRYDLIFGVLTALTVVVSMRMIGLLLIAALMIIPCAAAQFVARSFSSWLVIASLVGTMASIGGVLTSAYAKTPPGATMVLAAIVLCMGVFSIERLRARRARAAQAAVR